MRIQPGQTLFRMAVFLLTITIISLALFPAPSSAAEPIVHAVLFYSPTCGHCHKVMTEHLPPLYSKYGQQLDILEINTQTTEGQELFREAMLKYKLDTAGVPLMLIGEIALMGSIDIPAQLPLLIEEGLKTGGLEWPDLPGLEAVLATSAETTSSEVPLPTTSLALPAIQNSPAQEPVPATVFEDDDDFSLTKRWMNNFRSDLAANTVAVIVLIGMVVSVGIVGYTFISSEEPSNLRGFSGIRWPNWTIPLLCLAGIAVASYLSYVEISGVQAVCGPVGNCNAVQESPYATLWGFMPVGIFGLLGYVGIMGAWLVNRFAVSSSLRNYSALAIWGMALVGVLFSIYLTFLEPFVIGATCAWCIASAILITLLLWISTRPALEALEG